MNVLYVGHYNESSGWGQAARDYILALDHVGVNVVPRAINLGLANFAVPDRIRELECGDITSCDVIVQHVLPHYMKYDSHFKKNIGFFVIETQNIGHTSWIDNLNIMDELWVPCNDMLHIAGVKPPIKLLPHTFNMSDYNGQFNILNIEALKGKFVFYFIGQYNRRKHISGLLRAFHTEFEEHEPVALVLKVNKPGMSASELAQEMTGFSKKIKENLRLYNDMDRYHSEVIITIDLERQNLLDLHNACDCFVCSSFGEAWCIPAFEAMAMGNIVIASNTGGPATFIKHDYNGFLVDGTMEPVFGEHDAFPTFGTSRELEFSTSVVGLSKRMRYVFENRNNLNQIGINARESAHNYSYENIGNKMKELLNV